MTQLASRVAGRWHEWRDRLSLRAQLVAVTAVLASLVAIGLIIVVQVALAGASKSATERVMATRCDTIVASIDESSRSTPTVPSAQLGPGVVVYDAKGRPAAGSIPPSMQQQFDELSRTDHLRVVEGGEHHSIMGRPFTTAAGLRGVVVVTEPLAPYERSEEAAAVVSVVAGALLVLMAAGSAALVSKRMLSPVELMARTADEWSEHDLERRFDLGEPNNEIRALGSTLDGLLDKVASVIRAEQRLTSELAHELRTPLTTIHGAADLLSMRNDLDDEARGDVDLIKGASSSMSTTISVLLDIARRDNQDRTSDRTHLDELADGLTRALPVPADRLDADLPGSMWIGVPQALAVRAIAPVLTNALGVADHVRVAARRDGRTVELRVSDDGPGIADDSIDALFDPGWSGTGGSGLGLSLARRVARSGGGEVTLVERHNAEGGATFAVTFPGGPAD